MAEQLPPAAAPVTDAAIGALLRAALEDVLTSFSTHTLALAWNHLAAVASPAERAALRDAAAAAGLSLAPGNMVAAWQADLPGARGVSMTRPGKAALPASTSACRTPLGTRHQADRR